MFPSFTKSKSQFQLAEGLTGALNWQDYPMEAVLLWNHGLWVQLSRLPRENRERDNTGQQSLIWLSLAWLAKKKSLFVWGAYFRSYPNAFWITWLGSERRSLAEVSQRKITQPGRILRRRRDELKVGQVYIMQLWSCQHAAMFGAHYGISII